ncbi:hypothetical protein B0T13DRAFT_516291 [Neurospora crassa]|nr:hypothetical protein B0T13DRAFT_516291 [Neurospora crassa]
MQHQAHIQQQAFMQYEAYLQHQAHLQHQAAINQQILVQHTVPHHQVAVQHLVPVQQQVPEVPVPVPIAGGASPAGDLGPPTPHPEANHPSVIALRDVGDDLDAEGIRELIRAATAVLFAGYPQCRKIITGDLGVEVRCTACS